MDVGRQFDRQTNIRAVSSRRMVVLDLSDATSVPAGGNAAIVVTPAQGVIARVVALYADVQAVAGAGSGTHYLFLAPVAVSGITYSRADTSFDGSIALNYNAWTLGGTGGVFHPPDPIMCADNLRNIVYDVNAPLQMVYVNKTNVASVALRRLRLLVEEEVVA